MTTRHPDLFGDVYPSVPGYRATDTSQAAAEAIRPKVSVLRQMVLDALSVRPMTTLEIAHHCRQRYETLQPRSSELKDMGLIEDSGLRWISRDPRKTAIIWRLTSAPHLPPSQT
jgi:hypothetical protein